MTVAVGRGRGLAGGDLANCFGVDFLAELGDGRIERQGPEIAFETVADRDRASFAFLFADDEHVGNELHLGVADFRVDLGAAVVARHAQAGVEQAIFHFVAVSFRFLADREHPHLLGASHSGNAPAKCSISTPTNRSSEPSGARWIITG